MKFRCERDVLAESIGVAARAATGRAGALPVLSGVRLDLVGDVLTVTGTDLELSIQAVETVAGESDGSCVLPGRLAGDIVRSLDAGAVGFELVGDEARITAGRSSFTVRSLAVDDFPRIGAPAANAVNHDLQVSALEVQHQLHVDVTLNQVALIHRARNPIEQE